MNNYEPIENVRFYLHVYPWKTNFPPHGSKEDILQEGTPAVVSDGLLSMQIHRSKDNPYGTAVLNFYGEIPSAIFPGNWCLIRSYDGMQNTEETNTDDTLDAFNKTVSGGIVKFFGQIYSFNTSYQVNANGGLAQHTSINIREWSFLYSVPVRYDSYAMLNTVEANNIKWANQFDSTFKNKDWDKAANIVTDAFQFCALTLQWIGALSNKGLDQLQKGDTYKANFNNIDASNLTLPDVALLLPKIPRTLLQDLGVTGDSLDSPFAGDLVIQQFGVQGGGCSTYYDSTLGAFNDSLSFSGTIDEAKNRPLYSDIMSVFVNGQSVWELLNQGCDKFVNEIFSDLIYYKENGKVIARPLLVFRDKPFMLKKYRDLELGEGLKSSANWSCYDNLPRIDVPTQTIERADFSISFTDSPNFIRVQYVSQGILDQSNQGVLADLKGTIRLPSEMLRFGGQTSYIQTPYTSGDGSFLPLWYRDVSTLHAYWNGLLYRMPSCQLTIRDTNLCFTVGFNVRFKFNDNTFVGHLKYYSITYSRSAEGTHRTTTVLNLERVVIEQSDGNLGFMPESLIRNIYSKDAVPDNDAGLMLNNPFQTLEDQEAFNKTGKDQKVQKLSTAQLKFF
jgi:hypothetical protein